MKNLLALLLLLTVIAGTNAQDLPATKVAYYNWIYLNNSSTLKGVIVQVSDSSLLFVKASALKRGLVPEDAVPLVIPVSDIRKIKYRKRAAGTKGAILGALGGAALGAVVGYADGDDTCSGGWFTCIVVFSAEEKAGIGALLGIIPGMGMGLLISKRRDTIHINGDQEVYNLAKEELKVYTLTK